MSNRVDKPEIEESGVAVGGKAAVEADGPVDGSTGAEDDDLFPEEFKQLWSALDKMSTGDFLEQIVDEYDEAPDRRREILTTWMAQHLGYSRVWKRRTALIREPLWELLTSEAYAELTPEGEKALAMIGESVMPARSFMHPSAALATLAIWRHTDDENLRRQVQQRIEQRALPDEPEWLYEVVGAFVDDDSVESSTDGRSLAQLVELVLSFSYWEIGALLCGLLFVQRYGRWYHSAVPSNLTHACDIAAREHPHEARRWIDYLAEATMGGHLSHRWLEEPFNAAIRLSIEEPEREQTLRRFMEGRPFDADHDRLEELYRPLFDQLDGDGYQEARRRLFQEVETTATRHPARALRLLELLAIYEFGPPLGSKLYRLRKAVERLAVDGDDQLCRWMVGLYVHTATLEPHAAELVRRSGELIDWEANPFAGVRDYETYLVISDYERAFEELTVKFDGVTLEHADKYAAARIKFFVQKRMDPSRIRRAIQAVFRPVEWLGSGLTEVGVVGDVIERGMERFEEKIATEDRRREVVDEFQDVGIEIDDYGDIYTLPVDRIDRVIRGVRNRRLLMGAAAGGLSGGLAPYSYGVLSLGDIPVMLTLTADVASRFCWYYGFDPRQHPDLPFEILAVALGGTRPEAIEPMLVRQSLHSHVFKKSIVVGALAHGGVAHLTGKGLSRLIQRRVERTAMERAGRLARRAFSKNFRRRIAEIDRSPRGLPVVGAIMGAILNTVLIYDICEAAQAVLTDRFLERKYPDWARHISRIERPDGDSRR